MSMSIWEKITRRSRKYDPNKGCKEPGSRKHGKIKKCLLCDKPSHEIDDWFGGGPGLQDFGEPLKSEYCIDHLVEKGERRFNDQVKGYAKAVNKWQEKENKLIERAILEKKLKMTGFGKPGKKKRNSA